MTRSPNHSQIKAEDRAMVRRRLHGQLGAMGFDNLARQVQAEAQAGPLSIERRPSSTEFLEDERQVLPAGIPGP